MADNRIYSEQEKIQAALRFVEPDERDTWVQVAIAIKSELGENGFEIWDSWSAGSKRYKEAAAKSVWKSANSKGITIGSLYGLAKRNGFNPAEYQTQVPDPALMEQRRRESEARAQERAAEELRKQERAAAKAAKVLAVAQPIGPDHPYLVRKQISSAQNLYEMPVGQLAKILGYEPKTDDIPLTGRILIAPVGDHSKVTSLEFIDEEGRKSALAWGRKSGAWWLATPGIDNPDAIIVGEGIATDASIAEAGLPGGARILVAAALSDTNMPNVARVLRLQYPATPMVIATDVGNGEKKAFEAAYVAHGWVAKPNFSESDLIAGIAPTDYNDLAVLHGHESVRQSLGSPRKLDEFDKQLIQWWRGELKVSDILTIGEASPILQQFGASNHAPIHITQNVLKKALDKHEIAYAQLVGTGKAIQAPLAVFASKRGDDHVVLLTEVTHASGNVIAALELNRQRDQYLVNDIRSLHPKDAEKILNWIEEGLLRGVEKTKGREWLEHSAASNSRQDQVTAALAKSILYDSSDNARPMQGVPGDAVSGSAESVPQKNKNVGSNSSSKDFRAELTNKIIAQLEQGTAPWQKPWVEGSAVMPYNAVTDQPYHGMNTVWLDMQGYSDPRWATYKQAQANGWQVRKGEKGTPIEFWKRTNTKDATDDQGNPILDAKGKPKKVTVLLDRPIGPIYATLFNLSQMDNVPEYVAKESRYGWDPVAKAEGILKSSGAKILHDQSDSAFYAPSRDQIHLPPKEQFASPSAYYGTALHELGHWTGHQSRLDRDLTGGFGSESYAREELRAELASYFMSAELGVPHDVNRHASYVESWVQALKSDKNEIFRASRDAEKIADYVIGLDKSLEIAPEVTASPDKPFRPAVSERPKPGEPIFRTKDLPGQLADDIRRQFGEGVRIAAPRIDAGPYKGELYRMGDHLIQEVGTRSVVVHGTSQIRFTEPALDHLAKANAINGTQAAIRYEGDCPVVSPYDRQIEQLALSVASLKKSSNELGMPAGIGKTLDTLQDHSARRIYESRRNHGLHVDDYIKEVKLNNHQPRGHKR